MGTFPLSLSSPCLQPGWSRGGIFPARAVRGCRSCVRAGCSGKPCHLPRSTARAARARLGTTTSTYGHLLWGASPTPQCCGASEPLSRLQLSPAAGCCPAVLHSLEEEPGFVPRLPRFLPAAVSPGCSFRDGFFQTLGPGCRARCCRVAAIGAPVAPPNAPKAAAGPDQPEVSCAAWRGQQPRQGWFDNPGQPS